MKRIIIITLVLGCVGMGNAQMTANLGTFCHDGDDQKRNTLLGDSWVSGGFLGISSKGGRTNGQDDIWVGGEVGMVFNRNFQFGIAGYGLVSTVKSNNLNFNGKALYYQAGYGGFLFEPGLFSNQVLSVSFPTLLGAGGIVETTVGGVIDNIDNIDGFEEEFDFDGSGPYNSDVFLVAEPGVALNLNITRWMKITGGVSYRLAYNLDLPNSNGKELDGLNANVTLKLGWF